VARKKPLVPTVNLARNPARLTRTFQTSEPTTTVQGFAWAADSCAGVVQEVSTATPTPLGDRQSSVQSSRKRLCGRAVRVDCVF